MLSVDRSVKTNIDENRQKSRRIFGFIKIKFIDGILLPKLQWPLLINNFRQRAN